MKEIIETTGLIVIILLAYLIGLFQVPPNLYYNFEKEEKETINNESTNFSSLYSLLDYERDNNNVSGNCYDYASYYYPLLIEKYPKLDVEWIRHFKVCEGLDGCNYTHTFLIVGGYYQECIFDQESIKCISLDSGDDLE